MCWRRNDLDIVLDSCGHPVAALAFWPSDVLVMHAPCRRMDVENGYRLDVLTPNCGHGMNSR